MFSPYYNLVQKGLLDTYFILRKFELITEKLGSAPKTTKGSTSLTWQRCLAFIQAFPPSSTGKTIIEYAMQTVASNVSFPVESLDANYVPERHSVRALRDFTLFEAVTEMLDCALDVNECYLSFLAKSALEKTYFQSQRDSLRIFRGVLRQLRQWKKHYLVASKKSFKKLDPNCLKSLYSLGTVLEHLEFQDYYSYFNADLAVSRGLGSKRREAYEFLTLGIMDQIKRSLPDYNAPFLRKIDYTLVQCNRALRGCVSEPLALGLSKIIDIFVYDSFKECCLTILYGEPEEKGLKLPSEINRWLTNGLTETDSERELLSNFAVTLRAIVPKQH